MIGFIFILTLLLAVWFIPGWKVIRAADRAGGSPLLWALLICGLSLTGWVVWTGWPNVRGSMVLVSFLAPYAVLLVSRAFSGGKTEVRPSSGWALPVSAAIMLVYGFWAIYCGVQYKMWNTARGSGEGGTLGELAGLRSGLQIYYGDTDGKWPQELGSLAPKYITKIPKTHAIVSMDGVVWHKPSDRLLAATSPDDSGGWGYSSEEGKVYINCTHMNLRGDSKLCDL